MPKIQKPTELTPRELCWSCSYKGWKFKVSGKINPAGGTVGQERALRALKMGVKITSPGYNIFVSGLTGTGRSTTVKYLLENLPLRKSRRVDRCYVQNFRDSDCPRLLTLQPGEGHELQQDMAYLIDFLLRNIPLVFDDEAFMKKRESITEKYGKEEKRLFTSFEQKIRKQSFILAQIQTGPFSHPEIFYLVGDKAYPVDQLEALVANQKVTLPEGTPIPDLQKKYTQYKMELATLLKKSRDLSRQMTRELEALEHHGGRLVLQGIMDDLHAKYDQPAVHAYLEEVEESLLANIQLFKRETQENREKSPKKGRDRNLFWQYQVNIVLDSSGSKAPPVIIETSPTFTNLFGTIEKEVERNGFWSTDFTKVKGGSLLKADGGYIVLYMYDLLTEPFVYKMLKRTLKNRKMEIQGFDSYLQLNPSSLKPEPIDLDVKVIVIGDAYLYHLLYVWDEDFRKIFKLKADFDREMPLTQDNINKYLSVLNRICQEEGLKPLSRGAMESLLEFGVRRAGRQNKLTTKFSDVVDLVREASFWATEKKQKIVTTRHIQLAKKESETRSSMLEDKIQELILENSIMIDTHGKRVGQINGLSVYSLGNYEFGKPCRITAATSLGKGGIINIEREAKMSGRTHDKGVLIISGYLRSKYGRSAALNLTASICFEQSYGGVDGDSASAAEIYAIISDIAQVPIRQDLAITGSVNQKGDIQPIGGVNHKIEGFYAVAKAQGLTGHQGVIIPWNNVADLMLNPEVVEAVRRKKFHVYPIRTIDDGIPLLMDLPAGKPDSKGNYPANCLHGKVLAQLAKWNKEEDGDKKEKDKKP